MQKRFNRIWLIPILILLCFGIFLLPPVYSRAMPRIDGWIASVKYLINPPDKAVFQPQTQTPISRTKTPQVASATPSQTQTPKPGPTLTPTITSTPLPASVNLSGFKYIDQLNRWNYCGPANLTMALNYWGWKGNRDDIAKIVKPGDGNPKEDFVQQGFADKNVMPYELVSFVNEQTQFRALMRYGGDKELIKSLIAAGFPVIVEKGYYEKDYTGKVNWLGHYLFTTGYDEAKGGFIVQDAWLKPGKNMFSDYTTYLDGWRSFNYLYMVVYPVERENEVLKLLGPWADETWAGQHALGIAQKETQTATDLNLFFAWFNVGTSHVALQEYADAASAYDQAFSIYASLNQTTYHRPYRMVWYQTGPYFAYFYAARYQDVVNLANITLDSVVSGPTLEESLIWRGRASYMLGNTQAAIADYRAALKVHTKWQPALQALQDLGVQP